MALIISILEPEPSFLALDFLFYFGARAKLFVSKFSFWETEQSYLALDIFILELEPSFSSLTFLSWSWS